MNKNVFRLGVLSFIVVGLLIAGSSVVNAGCQEDPEECYTSCGPNLELDLDECVRLVRKVVDGSTADFDELRDECTDADGDYKPRPLSGTDVIIYCSLPLDATAQVWGITPVRYCSCVELGTSGNPPAEQLSRQLGLTDISISGIFAGQLDANGLVQLGILLLLGILTVVILVLIIINGMKIAGSGADEQKKQVAIKGLTNAIIGFVIIIASYLILSIFFSFFGLSPFRDVLPIECEGLEGEAYERCINVSGD